MNIPAEQRSMRQIQNALPKVKGRRSSIGATINKTAQTQTKTMRRLKSSTEINKLSRASAITACHNKRKQEKSNRDLSQILAARSEKIINARKKNIDNDSINNDQTIAHQTTASEDTYRTKNTSYGKHASQRIFTRIISSRKMYQTQKKRIRAVPLRRSSTKQISSDGSLDLSIDNESTNGTVEIRDNDDYSLKSNYSLNELSRGFLSGEEDDDLTIISKSSKNKNVLNLPKTDPEPSYTSYLRDEEAIILPFANLHHEQDDASRNSLSVVSCFSSTDGNKRYYRNQQVTDSSSLPDRNHLLKKVTSTLADTSSLPHSSNHSNKNKTDSIQQRKEMPKSVESLINKHVNNRRGSIDYTRNNINREEYYRLEYTRRHSMVNCTDNGNSSINTKNDIDNHSLSSKTYISNRTDNSLRLRAIPSRRIEKIRSSMSSSHFRQQKESSSSVPVEISFSNTANQYLFSGSNSRVFKFSEVDNSTAAML